MAEKGLENAGDSIAYKLKIHLRLKAENKHILLVYVNSPNIGKVDKQLISERRSDKTLKTVYVICVFYISNREDKII